MIVRIFFIFTIIQYLLNNCFAASGLIWDKREQNFVQLYSIPKYAALHAEKLAKNRLTTELYRFDRKPIRVTYYEAYHIAMFYENNTRITGILGDLWTTLSDYLNFTLIPVKCSTVSFGKLLPNGSYDGIMGMFQRNETDVILRTGQFKFHKNDLAYTMPIYRTGYSLLIRPKWYYDNLWLISMFSPNTWYFIISLFVILSIFGYIAQKIPTIYSKEYKNNVNFNLSDHIFHTFAVMCSQGYLPKEFFDKFKILSYSKNIFSWLIFLTFSSNLIYQMTNRKVIPPFNNITDLLHKTDYIIVSFLGSMVHEEFENRIQLHINDNPKLSNRIKYVATNVEMYQKICEAKDKYAIFEVYDMFVVTGRYACTLIPVGKFYFKTWIAFGMQKYLPYKRTIDVAIIKMQEIGLVDRLKDSWLFIKLDNKITNEYKKIDLNQIYVIFCILSIGFVASILVLAIEHLVFYYERKIVTKKKRIRRKVSYYLNSREEESIVTFSENDTKISGIAGEIWNLLAESLNFTLKPIRSDIKSVGGFSYDEKGVVTYQGLLGLLQENKTDVVPKVGMYSRRLAAATFTPAFWTTPHRLFVRIDPEYDSSWAIYLFDWNVWYLIAATYFSLTICGYISQLVFSRYFVIKQKADFFDHCFYNFAMLCKQGCIPDEFKGRSRIIELSLSLFCTIIHIAFSVLVFNYMTTKIAEVPSFNDLESLKNTTNYSVVIVNGSVPYLAFKLTNKDLEDLWKIDRLLIVETDDEIVIKLLEVGLISRMLKQIEANIKIELEVQQPSPIEMLQVSDFFFIPCVAVGLASIILVIENVVFFWNQRKSRLNFKNKIERFKR
ncbi:hypothetical protein M0802_009872 [Mischocyttarus mexicanus]|nr:hypothetical protein M0802_009872 [Mischocyttarus mexicanus]